MSRNNRKKQAPKTVEVEIIENPDLAGLGKRFIPPDDPNEPDDDDDGDGDEPDDFESLECAIDDLRLDLDSVSQSMRVNAVGMANLVKSNELLAATLAELTTKLGGLTGLGAIGKFFGSK